MPVCTCAACKCVPCFLCESKFDQSHGLFVHTGLNFSCSEGARRRRASPEVPTLGHHIASVSWAQKSKNTGCPRDGTLWNFRWRWGPDAAARHRGCTTSMKFSGKSGNPDFLRDWTYPQEWYCLPGRQSGSGPKLAKDLFWARNNLFEIGLQAVVERLF